MRKNSLEIKIENTHIHVNTHTLTHSSNACWQNDLNLHIIWYISIYLLLLLFYVISLTHALAHKQQQTNCDTTKCVRLNWFRKWQLSACFPVDWDDDGELVEVVLLLLLVTVVALPLVVGCKEFPFMKSHNNNNHNALQIVVFVGLSASETALQCSPARALAHNRKSPLRRGVLTNA